MLNKNGVAGKLLDYLIINKKLTRKEMHELAKKWGNEPSNLERRIRELREDYPIVAYDANGKIESKSRWICYWILKGKIKLSTVFK